MELTYSAPLSGAHEPNKTSMRNQELFNYMSREHGLTLLESEMHEIELIVARMLATDREHEAARQRGAELGVVTGSANPGQEPTVERAKDAVGGGEWEAKANEAERKLRICRRALDLLRRDSKSPDFVKVYCALIEDKICGGGGESDCETGETQSGAGSPSVAMSGVPTKNSEGTNDV